MKITHVGYVAALAAIAAGAPLRAQLDPSDTTPLRCQEYPTLPIKKLASVPADGAAEACRALALSIRAVKKRYRGGVDSAVVWRHDVPELGTNTVMSLYQIGLFVRPRSYVEVLVNRKTWRAEVQFLEGVSRKRPSALLPLRLSAPRERGRVMTTGARPVNVKHHT